MYNPCNCTIRERRTIAQALIPGWSKLTKQQLCNALNVYDLAQQQAKQALEEVQIVEVEVSTADCRTTAGSGGQNQQIEPDWWATCHPPYLCTHLDDRLGDRLAPLHRTTHWPGLILTHRKTVQTVTPPAAEAALSIG